MNYNKLLHWFLSGTHDYDKSCDVLPTIRGRGDWKSADNNDDDDDYYYYYGIVIIIIN